jgi:transcriptional regulator with XRE-family HTH domain
MRMSKNSEFPYKPLGTRLRRLREQLRETLAEVSGAVEIDIEALSSMERGTERPSEDILLLLISHFSAKEDEAEQLWHLAGYKREKLNEAAEFEGFETDEADPSRPIVMVMPMDARISYTDMAHVMVNDFGVVVNFMQTSGPNNKPFIVSRVGMSREHAESVVDMIQKALAQSAPKILPATTTKKVEDEQKDQTKNSDKSN